MYKIVIHNNQYNDYEIVNSSSFKTINDIEINPLKEKMFNNDNYKQKLIEKITIINQKIGDRGASKRAAVSIINN